jgi:hypothetical protein
MFRELLESNGYRIAVTNTGASSYPEQIMSIKMVLNDMCTTKYLVVCYYQDIKDYQIEQACLRYCIQNGIKLEWLDETTREEYECNHSDVRKLLIIVTKENWLDEIQKLIAAIYAHDIKIIAT